MTAPRYRTGELITVSIGKARNDGLCEGTLTDADSAIAPGSSKTLPLWIEGGVTGEQGSARVMHVGKHQAFARFLSPQEPSPMRRTEVPCSRWTPDSPCRIMHLNDEAQREHKEAHLRDALEEAGLDTSVVRTCVTSQESLGWRSKVSYVVARNSEGVISLGAFRRGTHRVQPMVGCLLPEPALQSVAKALEEAIGLAGVSLANPKLRVLGDGSCGRPADDWSGRPGARSEKWLVEDGLRYVQMRSNASGQVAVLLLSPSGRLPFAEYLAQSLSERCPHVVSVALGSSGDGNTIVGQQAPRSLHQSAVLKEPLGSLSVDIQPPSFFQVHRNASSELQEAVASKTLPGSVLDLYSGVGAISLRIAAAGHNVHGVDNVSASIERAKKAATEADLESLATFETSQCKAAVEALAGSGGEFPSVILNPPRRGCDSQVLEGLERLGANRVLYVSCNPKSLARDAAKLSGLGYRLQEATPYDLFPHSEHVETLAVFEKDSTG